jgi:hypothetical protein
MKFVTTIVSADLFGSDLEQDTHLTRPSIRIFPPSEMTFNEFLEVQLGPFSGDCNNATTDARCMFYLGWIKDIDRDTGVTLDIPHLLMAVDGVDQDRGSISIDPGLRHVR